MKITIRGLKKQAVDSLKGNWKMPIFITFILMLITVVIPLGIEIKLSGGFDAWLEQEDTPLSSDLINLVISIVTFPFIISVSWFYLDLVRKENRTFAQVVAIYKDIKTSLKIIAANIVAGILILLWTLLLVIPGIIKSLSYSQMFYLLKDYPELTVMEAITESRKRMKGLKGKYFLMLISFIGWNILGVITLGVGYLWIIPYMTATMASFYKEYIYNQK